MYRPPKRLAAILLALTVALLAPTVARAEGELPSKFDLRERGVVTPVKQQNPFGSCWAFSATAATESSILTAMNSTYAETGLDLSERYLSWYVARPVTENINKSQVDEGLNVYNQEAGPNHIFNFGGREECAATLYAQGIGPQPESEYPYVGTNHQLAYEDLLANKESYIALDMAALREFDHFSSDETLRIYAEQDYEYDLGRYSIFDVYSPLDDWSIKDPDEPGSGKLKGSSYTLTDNNVITYWVRKGTGDMDGNERYEQEGNEPIVTWETSNLYQDSIDQIKAELYAGRGVSVDFSIDDNVLNGDTWAIYNDHSLRVSRHAVCIVGWDDNYAASNFTHTRTPSGEVMKDSSGKEIPDERAREITTPAGDGAWICKNSWGSQTDIVPNGLVGPNGETKDANGGEWGIVNELGQHTGYFYLSYYDYTIGVPESFSFDLRENHDQENALQLDYLPASAAEWRNNNTARMWEANIFTLDKDMRIDDVGTRIRMSDSAPLSGFDVTYDLYKLNDGATRPDDGKHLATLTSSYGIEGYHRSTLDAPVYLKAGDRLGVVVQQSHTFGDGVTKYCVSAQETIGYRAKPEWRRDPLWGNPVVNEGESYWKAEGITDQEEGSVDGWLDITQPLTSALNQYLNPETWYLYENGYLGTPLWDFFNMDNFCIKAFGEPVTLEHVDAVTPTCETVGNVEYWCDPITGAIFSDENGTMPIEDATVAALGHNWEVTYEWAADNSGVTATRTCENDASHTDTAKSVKVWVEVHEPTATETGKRIYIATFNVDWAQTQVKEEMLAPQPFIDVTLSTAHSQDIAWLASSGISTGWILPDGGKEFRPYANVARADMAAFLYRLASKWGIVNDDWKPQGASPFADVTEKTSHYKEILWLAESKISEGWTLSDGAKEFRPYANIARADMAAFLCRLQLLRENLLSATAEPAFADVTESTPHYEDILWLAQSGISEGWTMPDGTRQFRPYALVARADMAAFLHRMDALS